MKRLRTPALLSRSALIAAVVGTLLSAVNLGDALIVGPWTPRLAARILFNFLVPFAVATAGAVLNAPADP